MNVHASLRRAVHYTGSVEPVLPMLTTDEPPVDTLTLEERVARARDHLDKARADFYAHHAPYEAAIAALQDARAEARAARQRADGPA